MLLADGFSKALHSDTIWPNTETHPDTAIERFFSNLNRADHSTAYGVASACINNTHGNDNVATGFGTLFTNGCCATESTGVG
jgi:hypothetical protein